jgi:hypothetical protein
MKSIVRGWNLNIMWPASNMWRQFILKLPTGTVPKNEEQLKEKTEQLEDIFAKDDSRRGEEKYGKIEAWQHWNGWGRRISRRRPLADERGQVEDKRKTSHHSH